MKNMKKAISNKLRYWKNYCLKTFVGLPTEKGQGNQTLRVKTFNSTGGNKSLMKYYNAIVILH